MTLSLLRVQSNGASVVIDGPCDVFYQIQSVSHVVVHIGQLGVQVERLPIVHDRLVGLLRVVVGVAEANQGLQLLLIDSQGLLVISNGFLCVPRFKQQVSHADECEGEPPVDYKRLLQVLRRLLILFSV